MFKTVAIFVLFVGLASASTVTLRNDTAADLVMIAKGNETVVAVTVPAGTSVVVDVGEGVFDRAHFIYAFGIGFAVMLPFLAYGSTRKLFEEAF